MPEAEVWVQFLEYKYTVNRAIHRGAARLLLFSLRVPTRGATFITLQNERFLRYDAVH